MPALNGPILMTADAVGGVWSYALELARGLAEVDVETTLAVLGCAPDVDQLADARKISGLQLIQTGFPLDWTSGVDSTGIEQAAIGLADLASNCRADVVQLNSPIFAAGTRFPAPVAGLCHSCLSTWWHEVKGNAPLPPEFTWRSERLRDGYQRCQILVAPSEAFAAATAKVHRLATKPVVVHNGRGTHGLPPATEPGDTIFTAGRLWDEGKNARTLDHAAALLDTPIHAAGALASPDGQTVTFEHLRTLGRLSESEVAERLATRPIFVSLSRYEPFGLAVLEAARAGCALVLSDVPTFRELWDGVASFVPADDAAATARAIQTVLDQPVQRRELGMKAAQRAGVYSASRMTNRMLAIYAGLSGSFRFVRRTAA
jgi:glycogen(starch) synthase